MARTLCRNKCMAVEEKQLFLVDEVKVKVDNLIAHRFWRQSRARLGGHRKLALLLKECSSSEAPV